MSTIEDIMVCLQNMIVAGLGNAQQTEELKVSIEKRLAERCQIVVSLLEEKNVKCEVEEGTDVTRQYLQLLFWLLARLNSTVARELQDFEKIQENEQTIPSSQRNEHTVPALSPSVLSVGHQNTLGKVYQFVVTLGIIPHLPTGVGVPIATRSKFGHLISSLVEPSQESLLANATKLLGLIQPTNVRPLFMAKHLGDLLSALALLSQSQTTTHTSSQSEAGALTNGIEGTPEGAVIDFKQELDNLVSRSYPPLIVRELLVLQSGGGAKTPVWLKALCGYYLTSILMSPNGVKSIIGGMITAETDDWQKFMMVGKVIATPPKGWTAQRYYRLIASQVLSLLSDGDQLISRQYSRVCAAVLSSISTKHTELMEKLFWQPLTSDLHSQKTEKQEKCLQTLYKIMCSAAEPQSRLLAYCLQILPDIFSIYLQHKGSVVVTDSRLCCEELLSTCLQYLPSQSVSSFLHDITLTLSPLGPLSEDLDIEETRSAAILFCVSKVKDPNVVQQFFVKLLEKLSSLLSSKIPSESDRSAALLGGKTGEELSYLILKYRVMSLLASLCETETKVCLQHPQYVINFVKSSLTHFLSTTESSASVDSETLSLSLGLLTALMSGASDVKLCQEDVSLLNELNDPLNKLSLLACVPTETRELALNIRVAIATQRLVWLDKRTQATIPQPSPPSKPLKLVSELSDTPAQLPSDGTQKDDKQVAAGGGCSSYKEALTELGDPLIAVKGHALIHLRKLIERKDKTTLANRKELLELLVQHLAHSDTYIYLSAISGLVALADQYPVEVLPAVCTQYRNTKIAPETRLKVGEVLTKVTRMLGDLAPAHSGVVLPAILIGCRSDDETLRASSLANLGELCKLLRYSMGNHVQEIVECLSASLIDSCQSSRKGSAYSISIILSELESRSFDVFGAEGVSRLYKALKSCAHSENDDVTTHHCAIAIAALDDVVKASLYGNTGSKSLEKAIYVLDAPPSGPRFD